MADSTAHREMRRFLAEADVTFHRRRRQFEAALPLSEGDKHYLLDACRIAVRDLLAGRDTALDDFVDAPAALTAQEAIVFVTLYHLGKIRGCQYRRGAHLLDTAIRSARAAAVDKRFKGGVITRRELPDTHLDVCIFFDESELKERTLPSLESSIALGVHALSVHQGERSAFYKNNVAITDRVDHGQLLANLCEKAGLAPTAWQDPDVSLRRYSTLHFGECFHDRFGPRTVLDLYRGRRLVLPSQVTRLAVEDSLRLCGSYVHHHIDRETGAMTYSYDPARDSGRPPEVAVEVLRCLAAAWALAEIGNLFNSYTFRESAERYCRYVIQNAVEPDARGFAYVRVGNIAHLGKTAFLLLTLDRLKDTLDEPNRYQEITDSLVRFIYAQEDRDHGYLMANLLPERGADHSGHLFYCGEALTALMQLHARTGDSDMRAVVERVFPFYDAYYDNAENRDYMAAWMSKPYGRMFALTGDERYARFVFKMNDNLIQGQKLLDERHPDRVGAFTRRCYSYSTGVYCESVAEGLAVARQLGDREREWRYRRSLLLGLRYLLQCQITAEDCFNSPHRAKSVGGLHTSIYEPMIRVDNVEHAAIAMLRALDTLDLKY